MKPVLLWLGTIPIRGYGAFVGAALVISMSLVMRYGRRIGLAQEKLLDASFAAVVGGLVGARLMYVVVHYPDFLHDPLAVFKVWEGGMMYFGGLVLGVFAGAWVAVRKGLPLWAGCDCTAPAMGAGQAIGRVACLVAGCCYGHPDSSQWAITFHAQLTAAPVGVPLFPIQIVQIAEGIGLWIVGSWLFRHRRFDGEAFLLTFALAGLTRFWLEGYRGDAARGFVLPSVFGEALSSSRAVGLAMFAIAFGIWVARMWSLRAKAGRGEMAGHAPAS